jgi:hypothetical protein
MMATCSMSQRCFLWLAKYLRSSEFSHYRPVNVGEWESIAGHMLNAQDIRGHHDCRITKLSDINCVSAWFRYGMWEF